MHPFCYRELIHTLSLVTGMDDPNNPSISIKDALKDEKRIKYHNDYLINLLASIEYVVYFMITQVLLYNLAPIS